MDRRLGARAVDHLDDPLGTGRVGSQAAGDRDRRRFPKFVLGFVVASLLVTWISRGYSLAQFNKLAAPALVAPLKDLRTWTFIFCFLSIGLTTRLRELATAGGRPFVAFTAGVVVNVAIGFVLSAFVFASYWSNLAR